MDKETEKILQRAREESLDRIKRAISGHPVVTISDKPAERVCVDREDLLNVLALASDVERLVGEVRDYKRQEAALIATAEMEQKYADTMREQRDEALAAMSADTADVVLGEVSC